jgi:hypothetical protein
MAFVKATKKKSKLRLSLIGPSGSGKTYTALSVARGVGTKIAVVDTERGSASLYADEFGFDVAELAPPFEPARYVEKIHEAEKAGYDVIILDSLSHAWSGTGGALDMVTAAEKRAQSQGRSANKFAGWRDVTPEHNKLVDAMLQSPCHIIATMRVKMEYVLEEVNGKKVPKKVGLAPIQRDGLEYEFTLVGDMNLDHELVVSKTRYKPFADKVFSKPGAEIGRALLEWLNSGEDEAPAASPQPAPEPPKQTGNAVVYLKAQKALKESGLTPEQWREKAKAAGVEKPAKEYTQQDLDAVLAVIGGSKSGQEAATNA